MSNIHKGVRIKREDWLNVYLKEYDEEDDDDDDQRESDESDTPFQKVQEEIRR